MFTRLAEPPAHARGNVPSLHRPVSQTDFVFRREFTGALATPKGGLDSAQAVRGAARYGVQFRSVPDIYERRTVEAVWHRDVHRGCANSGSQKWCPSVRG